jgi:hypothetical protein
MGLFAIDTLGTNEIVTLALAGSSITNGGLGTPSPGAGATVKSAGTSAPTTSFG